MANNLGTTTKMIIRELQSGPKKFYNLFEALEVIEMRNLYNRLSRMIKQGYITKTGDHYKINMITGTDRTQTLEAGCIDQIERQSRKRKSVSGWFL